MFINKNSITINGTPIGQYLVEAKFEYHKLWGDDSGRNLAGRMSGTFIGVFPKITMQFRKLTKAELEALAPILDSGYQTTTYYDAKKKQNVTMTTYSNDWEVVNKGIISNDRKNEGFSWSVISTERRS